MVKKYYTHSNQVLFTQAHYVFCFGSSDNSTSDNDSLAVLLQDFAFANSLAVMLIAIR